MKTSKDTKQKRRGVRRVLRVCFLLSKGFCIISCKTNCKFPFMVYMPAVFFSLITVLSALGRLCFISAVECQTRIYTDCHGDRQSASPPALLQWDYESGSDSDADRPDPDLVLDDLASRRFHSPSPAPPTNFAVPISPVAGGREADGRGRPKVTMSPSVALQQNVTCLRSENMRLQCGFDVPA